MNILPKKKWHVRTKDNIARVHRDEQQAADEEKERQRRIALAEQEARTDTLRQQARERTGDLGAEDLALLFGSSESSEASNVTDLKPLEHVNIFHDAEHGKGSSLVNIEHEQEKKAEQEKYEKSIGYLTYLGQSAQEAQHVKPWYTLNHEKRAESRTSSGMILQNPVKNSDEKLKNYYDPLQAMKGYLNRASKSDVTAKPLAITASGSKRSVSPSLNASQSSSRKHMKIEEKTPEPTPRSKTMEELRFERLRREEKEKQRTKQLLAQKSGVAQPVAKAPENVGRKQKYNTQFNPGLARQNIESDRQGYY